ncbi:hypothetical protein GDO81_016043 [Engystomops pustulosus]|uniref:Uncharacterized protein n=1 Tax=Engystomops pustulosus TaxID=76066 RepID=A0AAV7AX51_ENGPU|nr:hypothetical protein GDO81_016043 [Engystomops pustulosus]
MGSRNHIFIIIILLLIFPVGILLGMILTLVSMPTTDHQWLLQEFLRITLPRISFCLTVTEVEEFVRGLSKTLALANLRVVESVCNILLAQSLFPLE